ncbi:hypothetical protein HBH56_212200 [Parastagonospora nodorum]|uniref:Rhodopsin domain-containing protein n=1 Tax=Phaeosphaeria nodorum (strain SN15 / ATCC MYA-4574 / FGSC 10173) TaxID=321614 RepID=A0A7U2IAC9_PHANO|nr:hypothetical protein HBH56_212200 [Parastagonospora nodorum]QRD06050.1 hypothetical protein JI435_134700 [Parastagonospora nodorum SN15]KAH3931164.1 hypothetical protein HBH54_100810 [Parastagonospora nodorum]KAH3962875.1 hypothetical protein HBH52_223150 [Parastagonospora nodorum]KAH4113660.1 hypothetical protein HBH47_207670 [Parastagonospora nodorum]
MTEPPPLDTGYRWATVTADDRSGILYIVAFLTFTYSSLTTITRCFIKWHVLGLDDAAALGAQFTSLVQFALLLISLSAGLAKNFDLLSQDDYKKMAASQVGNQVALYISLGVSKIATIFLIQRLFTRDMKKVSITCHIFTAVLMVWTILAAMLVSVGCSPQSMAPKTASQTCPGIDARYKFVAVTDTITDTILIMIPSYLTWQLQMSIKLKLQVISVFAFRLPLIPLASMSLRAWIQSLTGENPGAHRTPAIVFQQAELCVSLLAATLPCLKSFIRSFDTGSGVKATIGSSNESGSNGRNGGSGQQHADSYQLSPVKSSRIESGSGSCSPWKGDDGSIRVNPRPFTSARSPPKLMRHASSRGALESQATMESDRNSQASAKGLFIRRETHWEVTSEEARRGSDANSPGMLRLA